MVEVNGEVRPQCVLCLKALAHNSLKEAKLLRHLETNHEKFVNKIIDVFKEKEHQVKRSRILCGDAVANKLAMVPLLNDTIKRRIQELSEDVLQQTIAFVKRSGKLNLQLDETTYIGNDAQVMVFVRYLDTNDYMEQFLFCRPLAKNTAGEQICKKVDLFFEEHQLEWSDCVPVCADGAPSMMECKKGFMIFVKK